MTDKSHRVTALLVACLMLTSGATIGVDLGSAQSDLELDVSAPSTVTAGESFEISASSSVPDLTPRRDLSNELTIILYIDGEEISRKTTTVGDGESTEVKFEQALDTSGKTEVEVEASITFDRIDRTLDARAQTTVDVKPEPLGSLSIDASGPNSIAQGETATYQVDISLPDSAGRDDSGDVIIEMKSGGKILDTQTVDIGDGDALTESLSASFEQTGSKTVTFEASGTIAGKELTASINRELSVKSLSIEDPELETEIPTSANVGEEVPISASVMLPEVDATDVSEEFVIYVEADGSTLTQEEITVSDGVRKTIDLSVKFDEAGETEVMVRVEGTVRETELTASRTRTVDVKQATKILGDLAVTSEVPSSVEVGTTTQIGASIEMPSVSGNNDQIDTTVEILVDGDRETSREISVSPGGSRDILIDYTFDSEGTHDITIIAQATVLEQELEKSVTKTIETNLASDGSINLDVVAPEESTVGEDTTFEVGVNGNSVPTNSQITASISLILDGETVAERSIDLSGGQSQSKDLTIVFDESGDKTVKILATATIGDESVSRSVERTIKVKAEQIQPNSRQGVAIPVPESLEDEISKYRSESRVGNRLNAFLLATQESRYIVFTKETPRSGEVTVQGPTLDRTTNLRGLNFGIIRARSVEYASSPKKVSIKELNNNPDSHRLELVNIDATYQRVATLSDLDDGSDVTAATTIGRVVKNPSSIAGTFNNLGAKGGKLTEAESAQDALKVLESSRSPSVTTFNLKTKMWADAPASVNGIVLSPGTTAYEMLNEFASVTMPTETDGEPILYVTGADFEAKNIDSVTTVKQQAERLDGEVVKLNVRLYQERYSSQETLEHSTACGEDRMQIQTPQGPACVNLPQDILLHGGVAWNEIPQSRDGVLMVIGASALHQDVPNEFKEGRYAVTGEVVSTDRISKDLPQGSILLIYDLQKVGEISEEEVKSEARSIIENRTQVIGNRLQVGIGSQKPAKASINVGSIKDDELTEIDLTQDGNNSTGVEKISIEANNNADDVQVNVNTVSSMPDQSSDIKGESVKTIQVDVGISDNKIDSASFTVTLNNGVDYTGGEIVGYRLHNGKWETVSTRIESETETQTTVLVETPGFSYFTLREISNNNDSSESAETEGRADGESSDSLDSNAESESRPVDSSIPGFSLIITVLALLISTFYLKRQ